MAVNIQSVDEFKQEVLDEKDKVVLVDFWAVWCMPCQMLHPIIEALSEEFGDDLKVVKVNVDEQRELAAEYGIMSIPTVILFKDGKPFKQFIGVRHKDEYAEAIKAAMGSEA